MSSCPCSLRHSAAAPEQGIQEDDRHRHARRTRRRARDDGVAPREGGPHSCQRGAEPRVGRRAGGRRSITMKYLPLVLANLGRHKKRTILTIASVALALFLFASLQTVVTTIAAAANFGSVRRLVSTNATGIVFTLP